MKKVAMGLLIVGMAAAAAVGTAWGQEKKVNFSLNAGVMTNFFNGSSFDRAWFTVDARAGVRMGRSFEISPEVMGHFDYGFDEGDNTFILYPGILLNYRAGSFFIGAGAVLPIGFFDGETDTANIAPKVNIGYAFGKLQLTAYFTMWTDFDFLDMNFGGLTVGYRF